ncbi:hypothetical protein PoMZ_03367, partial [Pyricularia oryzae]
IPNPAILLSYQDSEGRTSIQVGDHWGILGVACFYFFYVFFFIWFSSGILRLNLCAIHYPKVYYYILGQNWLSTSLGPYKCTSMPRCFS